MAKMNFTLKIWRQESPDAKGKIETYKVTDISDHISFFEMLDILNEDLELQGKDPVAFEHDCREGICGACSLHINGQPHGPNAETTTCQLHMRTFKDGDTIWIEPWRSSAFPVIKDLVVHRQSMDKIIQAGGFISTNTGAAPDASVIPIPQDSAEKSMDAAECVGCGACVAACKNGSAMLFLSAKISHLALLPQGVPERTKRVKEMVKAMDEAGFGNCTNEKECEAACPKGIKVGNIARLNMEFIRANVVDG